MQRGLMLGDLAQDLRICLRGLLRVPMMTMTIVVTVGLGIGAPTVIFSAVHAALLRPLPYADPDKLVRIYTDAPPNKFRFSVADYLALQSQQTHFEQIAGYTDREMAFSDGNVADRLRGRVVSSTYFALLGIKPALGRDFTELDGRLGSPPAVIVSHGFWQRRLEDRYGSMVPTTRSPVSFLKPSARWNRGRNVSWPRSGIRRGARAHSLLQRSHDCGTDPNDRRRRRNCEPSIGGSFRCGEPPIRMRRRRGA